MDINEQKERNEMLWRQLSNIREARNSEDGIIWSMFGTFWASNALLLVALFSTGNIPENKIIGVIISIAGIIISVIWYLLQKRALGHLIRFEEMTRIVEKELSIDESIRISTGCKKDKKEDNYIVEKYFKYTPRARNILKYCLPIIGLLWLLGFVIFIILGA